MSIADEIMVKLTREHLDNLPQRSFFLARTPNIWSAANSGDR
jgi:hypothetical protein